MNGAFNPADLDYFPPGHLVPNHTSRNWNHATAQKRFNLIAFDKIAFDTTPAYLVKGIIPRIGLCVFWGPPKCGKSFLVFDVLIHVALGWKYRGRRVQQGPVVYCAFEGQTGLRNRVEAFRQRKLVEGAGGVPFYLIADAMNLVADHPALIVSVRAALGDTKPVAVALDTLNRSLAGSESDDRDMASYVKAADALRLAFDCAATKEPARAAIARSWARSTRKSLSNATRRTISSPPSSL